jgi:hypothetical protein
MIRTGLAEVPGEWRPWSKEEKDLAESWTITEALLAALRVQVERAGSRLIVFYVPSRAAVYPDDWDRIKSSYAMSDDDWSPSADADRLREVCDRLALSCIFELTAFIERAADLQTDGERLYYQEDGHWTPAGHQLAAELIAARLSR